MAANKRSRADEQNVTEEPTEAPDELVETPSETVTAELPERSASTPKQPWFKRCWHGYAHHKKWTIPATILGVLVLVLVVPATRYPVLALSGVTQSYTITVTDSSTHTPVTGATVVLDGKKAVTNNQGKATVRGHVGAQTASVSKRYYKSASASIFVGIKAARNSHTMPVVATGRQVPIVVVDMVSKKPVENASVSADGTTVKTDSKGQATIVLPASSTSQSASITADGYNQAKTKIEITSTAAAANTFAITPTGRIYFLSNASGTIDVVSANLDGSDRKALLTGTGKEDAGSTQLTRTNDTQYLALQSRRDGGEYSKLFLIETNTGKLTTIDEGNASFSVAGWAGHRLIYTVIRDKIDYSQPKRNAIKSYNADTKKITLLDENAAETAAYSSSVQQFTYPAIVDATVLYATTWSSYGNSAASKPAQIIRINADGTAKKVLKEVVPPANQTIYATVRATKPQEVYFILEQYVSGESQKTYARYADGAITMVPASTAEAALNKPVGPYFTSPSGDQTFWSESRDGKYALFVGNQAGDNSKQIATQSEYQAYGWAGNSYVIVSKDSELYAMSVTGGETLKITAYLTPGRGGY